MIWLQCINRQVWIQTGVKYIAYKQAEKTDSQQLAAELGFMCASTMVEAVQGPGGKMQCQPSKTAPPICQSI